MIELHFTPDCWRNWAAPPMEWGLSGFIWTPWFEPCSECGQPTTWIDISFGCRLCPGPCSEKMTDAWAWADMMARLPAILEGLRNRS